MEFKKDYISPPDEFETKKLKLIGQFFFRKFFKRKSEEHLKSFILRRWKYLEGCGKVLDIGCSIGNFIKINPYNVDVWGMDIIKEAVNDLKKQGINAKQGDLNKRIPFKDNSFDGITCFHILEHIADPTKAISEIKRVLKNNGKLVIVVPNLPFRRFYDDYTHVKPYTKRSLYKLLKNNNFEEIEIKNGASINQFISAVFFIFPKTRFFIERLWGKISPFEIIAVGKNSK